MKKRTYPYLGWILQPSFKPVQIELVKKYDSYSTVDYGDMVASGKLYRVNELFPSKAAAIAEGRARVKKQQADLDKKQASLQKRITALDKAEAS